MDWFNAIQSGSFFDLKKRIMQKMQSAQVNDQISDAAQKAFEKALSSESIVLSRPEKQRLSHEILKSILTDMLAKLDEEK